MITTAVHRADHVAAPAECARNRRVHRPIRWPSTVIAATGCKTSQNGRPSAVNGLAGQCPYKTDHGQRHSERDADLGRLPANLRSLIANALSAHRSAYWLKRQSEFASDFIDHLTAPNSLSLFLFFVALAVMLDVAV
jgi:hypothetical protein